jgi:biopolymer transport protein TolR
MAFSMAGGGLSRPEINVTPLIDVLLVLIIVFMVVVAMDKEYVEKAQIPQADRKQTAESQQSRTIVIQIVWTTNGQPPMLKIKQENERLGEAAGRNLFETGRESCLCARRC